jgi:P pilus assembly chaperone PapD
MLSQPNKFLNIVVCLILYGIAWLSPLLALAQDAVEEEATEVQAAPKSTQKDEGGAGDLMLTPTRVVFSGRNRSAEIMLKNRGNKTTTYRISFIDFGVNEKGEYTEVNAYDKSAKDFIRYSPKQVTLEAGATQKVKLLLRKPTDLADGEYRSHLKFQAVPDSNFGADVEATKVTDQVSVKLIPLVGVSIPVIVQKGALQTDVSIKATRSGDNVKVTLNRNGARSLMGELLVKSGNTVISNTNASLLLPAKSKNFTIALPEAAGDEKLTIEYVEMQDDGAKPLASTSF